MKKKLPLQLFLIVLFFFMNACGSLESGYYPTGLNNFFNSEGKLFKEYILETQDMIRKARRKAKYQLDMDFEKTVKCNSPFECRPKGKCSFSDNYEYFGKREHTRNGILLVHGLSDSPYLMRDIAFAFKDRGFLVRSLLLPGHGTVPGDLLEVNKEAWKNTVRYGLKSLNNKVDNLYVGGFSTGGAVEIYLWLNGELMMDWEKEIKGMILLSPAVKISNMARLIPLYKFLGKTFPVFNYIGGLKDDVDTVKYESFAANAGLEILRLTDEISFLSKINQDKRMPIFLAMSEQDATINSEANLDFFKRHADPEKSVLVYYTKEKKRGKKLLGIKNSILDYRIVSLLGFPNIISFSHVALPFSIDNRHYGLNGEYKHCLYYKNNERIKCRIAIQANVIYGEKDNVQKHKLKKEGKFLRRLTFNPDFKNMIDKLFVFVNKITPLENTL